MFGCCISKKLGWLRKWSVNICKGEGSDQMRTNRGREGRVENGTCSDVNRLQNLWLAEIKLQFVLSRP